MDVVSKRRSKTHKTIIATTGNRVIMPYSDVVESIRGNRNISIKDQVDDLAPQLVNS